MKPSEVTIRALEARIKLLERRRERIDLEIADMRSSLLTLGSPGLPGPAV